MQSLSPEARARLAAFRRAESPAEADAARCLAALELRLAAPPASPRRRVAIYLAGGLALAAGLLLALRWATTPARHDDARGQQAPYELRPEPPAVPETRALVPAAPPPRPSVEPGPVDPVAAPAVTPEPEASPVPQARRPRLRAGDDIAAEVALLREAKLAEPGRRLELLGEHARRFASGSFAAERELLLAKTRCDLGEVEAARALVASFPQRFPGSPLAARVAKICVETPGLP